MRFARTDLVEATRPTWPDRILDRRTSGQIVASMVRNAVDPVEADKRRAFYAAVAERDRREAAKRHNREAYETLALEMLEANHG